MNMLKKRYWVIGFDDCYPCGFEDDIEYTSDSLKDAKETLKIIEKDFDNSYIFDVDKREFIQ